MPAARRPRAPRDPGPEAWDRLAADLHAWLAAYDPPSVTRIAAATHDPFRVLVSTILSLRTQDAVTDAASERLFAVAATPAALADLPVERIAALIRPANFYPTKAARLQALSRRLLDEFGGAVPPDLDTLLTFDGVGRKTANLVLTEGFDLPGLCVDTHVHRIPNRLGFIATKDPLATETRLRQVLPRRHWRPINMLLVRFGQEVCRPTSPRCSACPLAGRCARVGVTHHR
jgi:endonuclease III